MILLSVTVYRFVKKAIQQRGRKYYKQGNQYYRKKDYKKSFDSFKKAQKWGENAYIALGNHYYYGKVPKTKENSDSERLNSVDNEKAFEMYTKGMSCKSSFSESQRCKLKVGYMIFKGYGCRKDERKGIKLVREVLRDSRLSSDVYVNALSTIAGFYFIGGDILPPNANIALRLMKLAKYVGDCVFEFTKSRKTGENKKIFSVRIKENRLQYDSEFNLKYEFQYSIPWVWNLCHNHYTTDVKTLVWKNMFSEYNKMVSFTYRQIAGCMKSMKKEKKAMEYWCRAVKLGCKKSFESLGDLFLKAVKPNNYVCLSFIQASNQNECTSGMYRMGQQYFKNNLKSKSISHLLQCVGNNSLDAEFFLTPKMHFENSIFVNQFPGFKFTNQLYILEVYFPNFHVVNKRKIRHKDLSNIGNSYLGLGLVLSRTSARLMRKKSIKSRVRWLFYYGSLCGKTRGLRLLGKTFLERAIISRKKAAKIGIRFLHQARNRGKSSHRCEFRIGVTYMNILKDYKRAVYFLNKGIEVGGISSGRCYNALGFYYDTVAKDTEKATYYFTKGHDEGNVHCSFQLGIRLFHGWNELDINKKECMRFFQIASKNGHVKSTLKLAEMYYKLRKWNLCLKYQRLHYSQSKSKFNFIMLRRIIRSVSVHRFLESLLKCRKEMIYSDIRINVISLEKDIE